MNTHFYTYMLYIFVVKEQNSHFYLGKMKQTTVWKLQVETGKSQTGSQLLCHSRDQNTVCVYSTDTSHAPILSQTPPYLVTSVKSQGNNLALDTQL